MYVFNRITTYYISSEVSIEGLEKTRYWDNLKKRFTDRPDAITFDSEVSNY